MDLVLLAILGMRLKEKLVWLAIKLILKILFVKSFMQMDRASNVVPDIMWTVLVFARKSTLCAIPTIIEETVCLVIQDLLLFLEPA